MIQVYRCRRLSRHRENITVTEHTSYRSVELWWPDRDRTATYVVSPCRVLGLIFPLEAHTTRYDLQALDLVARTGRRSPHPWRLPARRVRWLVRQLRHLARLSGERSIAAHLLRVFSGNYPKPVPMISSIELPETTDPPAA